MGSGKIINPLMLDTVSVIGTTIFPAQPIGGSLKELETIKINVPNPNAGAEGEPETIAEKIKIMDVATSAGSHPPIAGFNPVPPNIPTPPSIQRPTITPVQNTRVFFEGNLVTVGGDGMSTAPLTVPPIRSIVEGPSTVSSTYAKIIIGTQPV